MPAKRTMRFLATRSGTSLVVRGEELGFGGFPGGGQCPIHRAASLAGILSSPVVELVVMTKAPFNYQRPK